MSGDGDGIVADVISMIHSNTQSSYVTCSKLASKLLSYLSDVPLQDHPWNELNEAIERYEQSVDHPDLRHFRQWLDTISSCSNDLEERNYTLGRDKGTLVTSIERMRDLLNDHVDLHCFLLVKVIEQQDVRFQLMNLMNLTGMNVGNDVHGLLCDIVHLLIQIDPTLGTSSVIDHPIVSNCIRLIQTNIYNVHSKDHDIKSTIVSAVRLLTDLLLTNEAFPVHTYGQLSNCVFLRCMFDLVETNADDEILTATSIRFLLAFNLRFDYPHENPIMLTLLAVNEQISCRILIERLIMLFNRSVDPIEKNTGMHSVVKFFADLFGDQGTISDIILSDSDRRLIIEIISREVSNRSCADETATAHLSLLELILRRRSITPQTCPRIAELQTCFRSYLYAEDCSDENRFIVNEILRQHDWLSTNDMPVYI